MKGWIYVLELAPSGWVKVGKTESLTRRLTNHMHAAEFGGSKVVRVLSFAAADMDTAERQLLVQVAAHAKTTLVHGHETFAGLPFMDVARIADEVVGYRKGAAWTPVAANLPGQCATAMDAAGLTRVSLDHLRELLGNDGPPANIDLGRELRRAGVATSVIWCGARGRSAQGVKREWLTCGNTPT